MNGDRLLVGTIVWCPSGERYADRVDVILGHLEDLEDALNHDPRVDLLIINNECFIEKIVDRLKELCGKFSGRVQVHGFNPQIGWARGRNYIFSKFTPEYIRVAVTDCDQYFESPSWVSSIFELVESHPELDAYMIRPDKDQIHKKVRLTDGRVVDLFEEWLGTTNVLSHKAIATVGGYDCVTLPQDWGFHDAEYGRRLRASGILDGVKGYFIDPVCIPGDHKSAPGYDTSMQVLKNQCIAKYNRVFIEQHRAILSGEKNHFFDPCTELRDPDYVI